MESNNSHASSENTLNQGFQQIRNHYEVLNVGRLASHQEIKRSYRRLALLLHPDKAPSPLSSDGQRAIHTDASIMDVSFAELQEAWTVLGDERNRAAYDALLHGRLPPPLAFVRTPCKNLNNILFLFGHLTAERVAEDLPVSGEVDLDEMDYDEERQLYSWPCRCGDRFHISEDELSRGIDVSTCLGCSFAIRVLFELASEQEG